MARFANQNRDPSRADVMVLGLWNHGLEEARSRAREVLVKRAEYRPRVVFAQLVGSPEKLPSAMLRQLRDALITVVLVPNRFREARDEDPALKKAVLARLREEARLVALEQETTAPAIDEEAAKAVDQAYKKLSRPRSAQSREFLDEFCGTDEADDGVR
jgi:hypothetical protein